MAEVYKLDLDVPLLLPTRVDHKQSQTFKEEGAEAAIGAAGDPLPPNRMGRLQPETYLIGKFKRLSLPETLHFSSAFSAPLLPFHSSLPPSTYASGFRKGKLSQLLLPCSTQCHGKQLHR